MTLEPGYLEKKDAYPEKGYTNSHRLALARIGFLYWMIRIVYTRNLAELRVDFVSLYCWFKGKLVSMNSTLKEWRIE
jgi:hypothetical protein